MSTAAFRNGTMRHLETGKLVDRRLWSGNSYPSYTTTVMMGWLDSLKCPHICKKKKKTQTPLWWSWQRQPEQLMLHVRISSIKKKVRVKEGDVPKLELIDCLVHTNSNRNRATWSFTCFTECLSSLRNHWLIFYCYKQRAFFVPFLPLCLVAEIITNYCNTS